MDYKTSYPKLDLLRNKEGIKKPVDKKHISLALKIVLGLFIFFLIAGALFSYKILSVGQNIFQNNGKMSFFSQLKRLVLAEDKKIKGEEEGRTNILLLGMGGEGHEGALLTDTIMIVSLKYDQGAEKKVALISIPRDLAVPFRNSKYYKINSIYALGERDNKNPSEGGKLISQVVSNISGLPIHYYIRIDFEGFKKIVDSLGGIDIEVKNSFYDPMYPTANYGYQRISFKKGMTHMNGELALKYVRSRHGIVTEGEGNEASDFARAARQQQVLEAIKNKAFSVQTFINPKKLNSILNAFGEHIKTNMEPWEMLRLVEFARSVQKEKIINRVIDNNENGLLYATYSPFGAYILLPKKGDFSEIKEFCQNIFETANLHPEKKVKIIVLNGTSIPNLAKETAEKLKKEGFIVTKVGNAKQKDYEKTVIYNLKDNDLQTLQFLQKELKANIAKDLSIDLTLEEFNQKDTDMIIVLGLNASERYKVSKMK